MCTLFLFISRVEETMNKQDRVRNSHLKYAYIFRSPFIFKYLHCLRLSWFQVQHFYIFLFYQDNEIMRDFFNKSDLWIIEESNISQFFFFETKITASNFCIEFRNIVSRLFFVRAFGKRLK